VKLSIQQVRELGRDIVVRHPEGIGGVAISREIIAAHPEMATAEGKPNGTVRGGVWKLDFDFPDQIAKVAGGKYVPASPGVTVEEEQSVLVAYREAQARIRHRQIQIDDATGKAACALVPALRRVAASINKARSENGAAEHLGHIGIGGAARLRLEIYLRIKDKALDAADYPLDQLIARTGGERIV
jgi:hypothetical protein